jgi:HK97 family phage prohead protease
MKNVEYKPFEIKSVSFNEEQNEMLISGYAATFGNTDTPQMAYHPELRKAVVVSDTITKGAFAKTIQERKSRIKFCLNHMINNPVGKIVELKEDEIGLWVEVRISDAEPELKIKLQEGIYDEFSIGFNAIKAMWKAQPDGTYIRELNEIKLGEISVVTIARDEKAKITDVKSAEQAIDIIENLLSNIKQEEYKYQLMQLKALFLSEPPEALEEEQPQEAKNEFDANEFKNTILNILKN